MRTPIIILSTALCYGCATNPTPTPKQFPPPTDYLPIDQIKIKPKFQLIALSKENLAEEQKKCIPSLQENPESINRALRNFPSTNSIVTIGHRSSSKKFIYRGTTGLCLEYSTNQYPIFAAEIFMKTINPVGIPPDVTDEWYSKMALSLAIQGRTKVAYVSDKGTAFIASYWIDQTSSFAINYWSEFKKAGEWETIQLDHKFFSRAMDGVTEVKRGNPGKLSKGFPLAHE